MVDSTPTRRPIDLLTAALRFRIKGFTWHLLASILLATMVGWLILALWFPWPYRELCGGLELLRLVIGVDVVVGPFLTFVVFNIKKPRRELVRDISIIALCQLGALAYGLHSVYEARPVFLVFEVDRFRAITPADVYLKELPQALPAFRHLSLTGPKLIGTRAPHPGDEQLKTFDLAMQGFDIGQRPIFWQPFDLSRAAAIARSRPVTSLEKKYPKQDAEIMDALKEAGVSPTEGRFLPLTSRKSSWVTILDAHGNPAAFLPLNGFF